MAPTSIAQTLHGYAEGHRLLAVGGDVDAEERALLDRLSDLSGYLPTGTSFDQYHTGFPCGRYYAFAATWPDLGAQRAGTVLTHTLLVPLTLASSIDDLAQLTALHRRPTSTDERAPYAAPLAAPDSAGQPLRFDALAEGKRRAVITLFFGQKDRPILWVADAASLDVVRYLWWLLWAEARKGFAFCTLALQVRQIRRRPFDLLALPPSARGSFLEHANSPAWWDEGKLRNARLGSMQDEPWVEAILAQGAAAVGGWIAEGRRRELPLIHPGELRMLRRFLELRGDAAERLSAARACADLLGLLWPALPVAHAVWREVLDLLVARQGDGGLDPRPLWELRDLLARPQLMLRAQAEPDFAARAASVIEGELERRFIARPEACSLAWPEFLDAAAPSPWRAVVDRVFHRIMSGLALEHPEAAWSVLRVALERGDENQVVAMLSGLSPAQRCALVRRFFMGIEGARRTAGQVWMRSIAGRLADPELAFLVETTDGDWLRGLQAAAGLVVQAGEVRAETLAPLLEGVPSEGQLSWALSVEHHDLAAWAAIQGAKAAAQMTLRELAVLAETSPNGARVFAERAKAEPRSTLMEALREHTELAMQVVLLPLQASAPSIENVASAACSQVPPARLLARPIRDALLGPKTEGSSWYRRELLGRVAQVCLEELARGRLADDEAVAWLRVPLVQQWIRERGHSHDLGIWGWAPQALPRIAALVKACLLTEPSPESTGWVPVLLRGPLAMVDRESLGRASDDLAALVRLCRDRFDQQQLAAELLQVIVYRRPAGIYRLVELVFPLVYPAVLQGQEGPFRDVGWWQWFGWDRAKWLRHWLLDTWLQERWPEVSLLRALGNDQALFWKLVHRAEKSAAGRDLIRSLPRALKEAPELAGSWGTAVQYALREIS